ncbi:MAG: hypothetical protein AAGC55_05820, partial [Myxococcota bacterium]
MTLGNPTLLIGLGRFGLEVAAMVARAPEPAPEEPFADLLPERPVGLDADGDEGAGADGAGGDRPIQVIAVGEDELAELAAAEDGGSADVSTLEAGAAELVERAEDRCRRLLDLAHFIDSTAPTDVRGPRLDVFVIGDIGDERVAALVPVVVERLAIRLRTAFRPILGAGEGALAVCPMLAAPRRALGDSAAEAIRQLADLAGHPELARRPQAHIYVVEDQSGKYLLSSAELRRSFAAFLSLLLMSRVRDERAGRELVEATGDERAGPLATFACATLEIDMAALHELCALELSQDMLRHFDPGQLSLTEVASEAHPLVPERTGVEAELWQESGDRSLEEYLAPPDIAVPRIAWTDTPEAIIDDSFGPLWRLQTERTMAGFIDEVERFKMDRLAVQIERNGTELARRLASELDQRINREALASPRGPGRALEFARYAATRAHGLAEDARTRIDAPDLRPFPLSPLTDGVDAIDRACAAWPRRNPFRLRWLGLACVLCATFLFGSFIHLGLSWLLADGQPASPWWASGALGAAVAGAVIGYSLWRHIKRHYNWLCSARDELDQSLRRYLHRDVVAYFRSRLHYTRLLWSYR